MTGQTYRSEADRGGLTAAILRAINAAGYMPAPGTLHFLIDAKARDDPMPWAVSFLDVPEESIEERTREADYWAWSKR